MTITIFIICTVLAFIAFVIVYKLSDLFIPPREHWVKSKMGIFSKKFNMAFSIAVVVFVVLWYNLVG